MPKSQNLWKSRESEEGRSRSRNIHETICILIDSYMRAIAPTILPMDSFCLHISQRGRGRGIVVMLLSFGSVKCKIVVNQFISEVKNDGRLH